MSKLRIATTMFVVGMVFCFFAAKELRAQDMESPLSPSEFHGYSLGTKYTITSALYDYYRALAQSSPRVEYSEYGKSIQGRPFPLVMIGSEENLARKEEIRQRMVQLTHVTEKFSEIELSNLVSDVPAVVWIYIVDTDEEAGVEVLQEVAYELATREDEDARRIRENVLIILTPLTNPDSHARYVTWHKLYNVEGASLDPNAIENRAHWGMNTDGNAYGIDVNRDFSFLVSPEIRALSQVAMAWRPQFFLDIHSGPSVLFMTPYPPPYHPLWTGRQRKWWDAVARQASDNFGRKGWSFSSRAGYAGPGHIGFSDTWGMLGPAVTGFLYETFGGRPGKTIAFRRSDGTIATMRMAMDRHFLGIWSLLQVARDRREELLRDAHLRIVESVKAARSASVQSIVIPASGPGVDPDKVHRLLDRLAVQGIQIQQATQPFSARVRDYYKLDVEQAREFQTGTFVIDFTQPQAQLVRALLDPTLDIESATVVEVPFGADMPYYDATWAVLPYIFGVPAYAAREPLQIEAKLFGSLGKGNSRYEKLDRPEPAYAYVLPAGQESSYRVAIALMREGYRLRVFHAAFQIGERKFTKGTFAAIRSRNPDGLGERLAELAKKHSAQVIEIAGPYTDAGVTFGDDQQLAAIPSPQVAVVADWPVTQDHTYGGIRNVLETDFGFSFSPVLLSTINSADLSKYTAVVLPHAGTNMRAGPGFSSGYKGKLNLENLRNYVLAGGTLLVIGGAATVVADDPVLGQSVQFEGWAQYTNGVTLRAEWMTGFQPETNVMPWQPGVDRIGFPLLATGLRQGEFAVPGVFPPLLTVEGEGNAQILAKYTDDRNRLVLDGFMLESDKEKIAGRPFAILQPAGRGRVIYFADDITFRGYWYGLNLLFLNSLIFGPTL